MGQLFENVSKKEFYIDKTMFIKEWWENEDVVTVIMRPYGFGKTLNMSMLDYFFSNKYKGREDLFENFSIWDEDKYRKLQGEYPVISFSFGSVDSNNFERVMIAIKKIISEVYKQHDYLLSANILTDAEKENFKSLVEDTNNVDEIMLQESIWSLSKFLNRYFKRDVIILFDDFDTPLKAAYANKYLDELMGFMSGFFSSCFKSNQYLERAILFGVTGVPRGNEFSGFNNYVTMPITSVFYGEKFGFTEKEVIKILRENDLLDKLDSIKEWYGNLGENNVFRPSSILDFVRTGQFNVFCDSDYSITNLLNGSFDRIKDDVKILIDGGKLKKDIDDGINYNQFQYRDGIWSYLLAVGCLKVISIDYSWQVYELGIANREAREVFKRSLNETTLCNHF